MTITLDVEGLILQDPFTRADSTTIGNNFVERSGDWRIESNTLKQGPNTTICYIEDQNLQIVGGFCQGTASGSVATFHSPEIFVGNWSGTGYAIRHDPTFGDVDLREWSGGSVTGTLDNTASGGASGSVTLQLACRAGFQKGKFESSGSWRTVSASDTTHNSLSAYRAMRSAKNGQSLTVTWDNWLNCREDRVTMTLTGTATAGWKVKVLNASDVVKFQGTESSGVARASCMDIDEIHPLAGYASVIVTDASNNELDRYDATAVYPGSQFLWDGGAGVGHPAIRRHAYIRNQAGLYVRPTEIGRKNIIVCRVA